MIILDTNVLIYASEVASPFCTWSQKITADGVTGEGATVNAVCLAELCVGDADPGSVAPRLRAWGVTLAGVPAAASEIAARAYRRYREQRYLESGKGAPGMPLPDFFIGAHALLMGWELATADPARFRTYFTGVTLLTPD